MYIRGIFKYLYHGLSTMRRGLVHLHNFTDCESERTYNLLWTLTPMLVLLQDSQLRWFRKWGLLQNQNSWGSRDAGDAVNGQAWPHQLWACWSLGDVPGLRQQICLWSIIKKYPPDPPWLSKPQKNSQKKITALVLLSSLIGPLMFVQIESESWLLESICHINDGKHFV